MTKLQETLLEIVKEYNGHPTAEEIFLIAKNQKIDVSLASTYRILNKLSEEGLIKRVSNLGDKDLYDKWVSDHEHLVCSKCGKILDIKIDDFKKKLEELTGVSIDSYDLLIHYVCDECKKDIH